MKKLLVLASLLAAVAVAGCGSEEPASAPAKAPKKVKECINLPENIKSPAAVAKCRILKKNNQIDYRKFVLFNAQTSHFLKFLLQKV